MELVVMEFFLLVVVIAIAVSQKGIASLLSHHNRDVLKIAATYIGYLTLAALIHLHILGIVPFAPAVSRPLTILHILSVPLFIFFWMDSIEKRLLHAKTYHRVHQVQKAFFVFFALISFTDLFWGILYHFDEDSLISGGKGVPLMLLLSGLFIVGELLATFARWKAIEWHERVMLLLTAAFLTFSLMLFEIFRQPYMFSLSSAFMLLLNFLSWQRRELLLDMLTRIPSNQAFQKSLTHVVDGRREKTVLLLDIENFRLLNERYGEEGGDTILQSFSRFLTNTFPYAMVFRMGGNRFTLIFDRLTHNEIVREVNKIKENIANGCLIGEAQVSFHVNIAIVELPLKKQTSEEVLDSLNFTMAEIKEKRRQPVIIFNQKLIGVRQRRLDVLSTLRRALVSQDMIRVYFQPIMDIRNNAIFAAEALMRLEDKQLGIISPGEFIPLAEQAGLISMVTEIMLRKVSAFLLEHPSLTTMLSHISINISAEDLASGDVACRLLDILSQSGLDGRKIGFEVTESTLLATNPLVMKSWDAFSAMGVRFFLDDFGTGYANLESLVSLPFDTVKIDRSVVSNQKNDYELLRLISRMLQSLNTEVVAEGVETEEHLQVIRQTNIAYVQGYYFTRPLPPDAFLTWVDRFQG